MRCADRRRRPAASRAGLAGCLVLLAALAVPHAAGATDDRGRLDHLLHVEHRGEDGAAVVRGTVDGSESQDLAQDQHVASGAWSPDGEHVAYGVASFTPGAEGGLTIVAADGSDRRRIVEGRSLAAAWSPDGRWLAYSGPHCTIEVVAAAGGPPRQVTVRSGEHHFDCDTYPSWSPDGTTLTYHRTAPDPEFLDEYSIDEIRAVRADGREDRLLAADALWPVWSPRGDLIAFGSGGLSVVRPDGTGRRTLTRGMFQSGWSPDGTQLAVGDGDELVVVAVDTGAVRRLGRPPVVRHPDSHNEPLELRDPTWSADGARIAVLVSEVYEDRQANLADVRSNVWTVHTDDSDRWVQSTDSGDAFGPHLWPGIAVRAAGPSRIETAVRVSEQVLDAAPAVVIARGDTYPDALAGGPLAAAAEGPVLLSPQDRLHPATAAEVRRLGATTAYLLGGTTALSQSVADGLRAAGVRDVVRVSGTTRYATAVAAAERLGAPTAAYVVQGSSPDPARGWPDAVAVSALAAYEGRPILLVDNDRLPPETEEHLRSAAYEQVLVVGGPSAVSEDVLAAIRATGTSTERVAGADRFATSALLARRSVDAGLDASSVWLATGANWPDSLAAGPAAARDGGILLLAARSGVRTATSDWIGEQQLRRARLVGGPDVVDDGHRIHLAVQAR